MLHLPAYPELPHNDPLLDHLPGSLSDIQEASTLIQIQINKQETCLSPAGFRLELYIIPEPGQYLVFDVSFCLDVLADFIFIDILRWRINVILQTASIDPCQG